MSLPREIGLTKLDNEYLLTNLPSPDLRSVTSAQESHQGQLNSVQTLTISECCEIDLSFTNLGADSIVVAELNNDSGEFLSLSLDVNNKTARLDRGNCKWSTENFYGAMDGLIHMLKQDQITVKILLDVSTIEVFINDGLSTFTAVFFPETPISNLVISGQNVEQTKLSATVNLLS